MAAEVLLSVFAAIGLAFWASVLAVKRARRCNVRAVWLGPNAYVTMAGSMIGLLWGLAELGKHNLNPLVPIARNIWSWLTFQAA